MDGAEKTETGTETTKTKKGKAPKAMKKVAKAKEPKKVKTPKEPMVVFAFRLSEAQRDQIHRAAGPAKATKFVRAAALAAASGDRPAFEEMLLQAKSNLK